MDENSNSDLNDVSPADAADAALEAELNEFANSLGRGSMGAIEYTPANLSPGTVDALTGVAGGYDNFTQALNEGRFGDLFEMLNTYNPVATEALLERLYEAEVSSGEWVDRWVSDVEGNPTGRLQAQQRQIAALQSELQRR